MRYNRDESKDLSRASTCLEQSCKLQILIILLSLAMTGCSGTEDPDDDDDSVYTPSCREDLPPFPTCPHVTVVRPVTDEDLSGKAYIDAIGDDEFVVISFYPDGTYSDIANDNAARDMTFAEGTWDLSGNDISISLTDESFVLQSAEMRDEKLSFLLPSSSERVELKPTISLSPAELTGSFRTQDCWGSCVIEFESDNTGLYRNADSEDSPFHWNYLEDGSIEYVYDEGLGTIRIFFTEVINSTNVIFLALVDKPSMEKPGFT